MMKRTKMLMALGTGLVVTIGGVTMAWFTSSDAANNIFTAGTVKIDLKDTTTIDDEVVDFPENGFANVNPGDWYDKNVSVTSIGTKQTYVRVKLTPTWTGLGDNRETEEVETNYPIPLPNNNTFTLTLDTSNWVLGPDGFYYYKQILNFNETTTLLLDGVQFNGPAITNEYQGATFNILVEAQAVQASHYAFRDTWNITGNPLVPALGVEAWVPENEPLTITPPPLPEIPQ